MDIKEHNRRALETHRHLYDTRRNQRRRLVRRKAKLAKNGARWELDDLQALEFLSSGVCHYCEIQARTEMCLIRTELGYIYGNVVAACSMCQKARKKLSDEALVKIAQEVKQKLSLKYN